jgi:hypothetical protein
MNGLKAFGIGLGATAGVILGVYASVKIVEGVGYLGRKKEEDQRREYERDIDNRVERRVQEALNRYRVA